jgi:hypothetical protein
MILYPFGFIKPAPLVVGQAYQGGIICYLSSPTTGLIISSVDLGPATPPGTTWGCAGSGVSTSLAIGTGQSNTNNILAACATRPIAASLCDNYSSGGYSDWYLPSRAELATAFSAGIINEGGWWTSSQVDSNNAWNLFNGGFAGSDSKSLGRQVRAMRSF